MIEFILHTKPITKKNNGRIVKTKTGRTFIIPSKQYQEFEQVVLPTLYRMKNKYGVIDFPVNIECVFYTDARRKVDLPNLLNAVDDALVKSGLLEDDNRDIVAGHDLSRVFYDKQNPRIEIRITPLENYEQWKK